MLIQKYCSVRCDPSHEFGASRCFFGFHLPYGTAAGRDNVALGCPGRKAAWRGAHPSDIAPGSRGDVAEWLRNGLQNRVLRFNSGRRLQSLHWREDGSGWRPWPPEPFCAPPCAERQLAAVHLTNCSKRVYAFCRRGHAMPVHHMDAGQISLTLVDITYPTVALRIC